MTLTSTKGISVKYDAFVNLNTIEMVRKAVTWKACYELFCSPRGFYEAGKYVLQRLLDFFG